jgi:cytochrome c553
MNRAVLLPLVVVVMAAGPALTEPPGASSCTGCHVKGGGIGLLQGKPAADTVREMEAYRSGQAAATLMGRIAKGFTPDEVVQLAFWFQAQ